MNIQAACWKPTLPEGGARGHEAAGAVPAEERRDLFDLCVALEAGVDPGAVIDVFRTCMKAEGREVTRAVFEESLAAKLRLPAFTQDMPLLLPPGTTFDVEAGASRVATELVARLPGDPWRGRDADRRQ